MKFLADTNVLLRLTESQSPHHPPAKNAVDRLLKRGDVLFLTLQNVSEFWNVCTRPIENNGFGFSPDRADAELTKIERVFDPLSDTEDVYKYWRRLVVDHSILGVRVHDAKLVASMLAHGVQNLLTFNADDFRRYTNLNIFDPRDI